MKILEILWTPEIIEKIESKHGLTADEVEQACADVRVHIRAARDGRRMVFGRTDAGRYVFVVVSYQGRGLVRVITARDMTPEERRLYRRHN